MTTTIISLWLQRNPIFSPKKSIGFLSGISCIHHLFSWCLIEFLVVSNEWGNVLSCCLNESISTLVKNDFVMDEYMNTEHGEWRPYGFKNWNPANAEFLHYYESFRHLRSSLIASKECMNKNDQVKQSE